MLFFVSMATVPLFGADERPDKTAMHEAMKEFVHKNTVNGTYYLYDPVEGKLLALRFTGLHDGVASEGDFRASCADFTDQFGRKLDVDFVAVKGPDGLVITEAILHKIDGRKRPYSLKIDTSR